MFKEFRAFVLRGNAVDLAIGVVIGAAFTAVVDVLVKGMITPLIGIFGKPDFSRLTIDIHRGTKTVSKIFYGDFLNAILSLILVAAVLFFFVVKPMNKLNEMRREGEVEEPTTKSCPKCFSTIPVKATRCAFCTSTLSAAKAE